MEKQKKLVPVLVVLLLIVVVIGMMFLGTIIEKYIPSKEVEDLSKYYNLSEEGQVAIMMNHELLEDTSVVKDGQVYLKYSTVNTLINDRFYLDTNENLLLYTTVTDVITANVNSLEYSITKEKQATDYMVWFMDKDTAYIAADYVKQYTNMEYTYVENPSRVILTTSFAPYQSVSVKHNTQIRVKGGIKSPILKEVESDEVLVLLEEGDKWDKVSTQDGITGYILSNKIASPKEVTPENTYKEPEFTHNLKDYSINLGWHQVTSPAANAGVASILSNTKGMNVISPTWFYLNDNEGNLMNLADADYVNYCHQNGVEVWALVSNLENLEVDTTQVLSYTSKRTNMVNQLIAAAIQYDFDGINVDFESLSVEAGPGYLQFIRELSIKCKNNGITLSVDNYVPMSHTAFYDRHEQSLWADYIIVMAYDEHYSTSETAGSVSSIGFVTKGIEDTLKEVPANQIVVALPFYTRVWAETPKDEDGASVEAAAEDYVPYTLSSFAVGMQEGINMAAANGITPVWLEDIGQYYAEYVKDEVTYKIWLEDTTSLELKLTAIKDNQLAGAAFWKLGFEEASLWEMILKYVSN